MEEMQNEPNLTAIQQEMTKLKIDMAMVRQLIDSLTLAEKSNAEMLQNQADSQSYNPVAQVMPVEQQAIQQLQQMQQMGQQLQQHLDQLHQLFQPQDQVTGTNETVISDSPITYVDPMQRSS